MGQFHHPNVVELYGVISRVEPVMIVMEFLHKGSLDRYLQVLCIDMRIIILLIIILEKFGQV